LLLLRDLASLSNQKQANKLLAAGQSEFPPAAMQQDETPRAGGARGSARSLRPIQEAGMGRSGDIKAQAAD
jgi:hypothetical protein